MAINKSQSPMWVKVVLIILIVAFVSLFVGSGIGALFSQASSTSSQSTPVDQAQQINAQYQPQVDSLAALVASQPDELHGARESRQHVLRLGRRPSHRQSEQPERHSPGDAVPGCAQRLRASAEDQEGRRLWSTATMRSCSSTPGRRPGQSSLGERAVAIKPDFAVAWFNLGNFYLAQAKAGTPGAKQEAIDAYNRYLTLEPKGDRVDAAKSNIADAQKLP